MGCLWDYLSIERVAVGSRRGDKIGEVEGAGRVRWLPEVIVEKSLLSADLDKVRAFGNHQLRRIGVQSVREGGIQGGLIVEIGSRQVPDHVESRHPVGAVGLL